MNTSLWIPSLVLLAACQSAGPPPAGPSPPAPDPRVGPVELPAAPGWEARLLGSHGVGVWTVGLADACPWYAGPEVIALDDRGRCTLYVRNSGKTTPLLALEDGTWLGGLAFGDCDPHRAGPELYAGAQRGNLYQVVALPQGGFDVRAIAYFPGAEVHSLVVCEADGREGRDLVAGLSTGAIVHVAPPERAGDPWNTQEIARDPGRVRQMVTVELDGEERILYVSRSGRLVLLARTPAGFRQHVLHEATQGLARVAVADGPGGPVLWAIGDGGEVLRTARGEEGAWQTEEVWRGPEGGRGIATGALSADPGREAVAAFSYSGAVELLERADDGHWHATELFRDSDKGHWLVSGELDDRNETRELVLSGYSGHVVLLSRRPAGRPEE